MPKESPLEYWQRVGSHINKWRGAAWFVGVGLSIAVVLSVWFQWDSSREDGSPHTDLLLRAVVAFVAYQVGGLIIWAKVLRPAIKRSNADRDAIT